MSFKVGWKEVSRLPFYRRSSSWLSAVLSGVSRPPAGLPQSSAVESYCWSSLSAGRSERSEAERTEAEGGAGGGAERSGAESPLPALYVSPCSFLPLLPALSLPAGRALLPVCSSIGRELPVGRFPAGRIRGELPVGNGRESLRYALRWLRRKSGNYSGKEIKKLITYFLCDTIKISRPPQRPDSVWSVRLSLPERGLSRTSNISVEGEDVRKRLR